MNKSFLSVFKMGSHVSLSGGWVLIAILAPLLWGLLPIGYGVINTSCLENVNNELVSIIKQQPLFTVFVRSALAAVVTLALLIVWCLVMACRRSGKKWYWGIWVDMGNKLVRDKRIWFNLFLLLPTGYFAARYLEMNCVLGYGGNTAGSAALQKNGYFMGLLFVVLFPRNLLAFRKNFSHFKDLSFVEMLVWIVTGVIVVASGILYMCAYDAINVWHGLWGITGWALCVAFCCAAYTSAKTLGSIAVPCKDSPTSAAFLNAMIMNAIMCVGTAILALMFGLWNGWAGGIGNHSFGEFLCLYLKGWNSPSLSAAFFESNGFWMVWVVVVLATVIAPVCQLAGVTKHNEEMSKRMLSKYGISGSDWLVVCGGFEPLFVVVLGACFIPLIGICDESFALRIAGMKIVNWWTICLSFGLVICIAFLRIIKIWSEKNSALRNAIFTQIRGSAKGPSANLASKDLKERAKALIFLKFYDKRRELKDSKPRLEISPSADLFASIVHDAVTSFKSASISGVNIDAELMNRNCYRIVLLKAGDIFFTQDDPFTRTVLSAQFDWLKTTTKNSNVYVTSCSDVLKRFCVGGPQKDKAWKVDPSDVSDDELPSGLKRMICEKCGGGKNDMPFVLAADDNASIDTFCAEWQSLLDVVNESLDQEMISAYINGLIVAYDSNRPKCIVGLP